MNSFCRAANFRGLLKSADLNDCLSEIKPILEHYYNDGSSFEELLNQNDIWPNINSAHHVPSIDSKKTEDAIG